MAYPLVKITIETVIDGKEYKTSIGADLSKLEVEDLKRGKMHGESESLCFAIACHLSEINRKHKASRVDKWLKKVGLKLKEGDTYHFI